MDNKIEKNINEKNQEEFERVMGNASTNYDSYWDKNNPIIKIILLLLFAFIVIVGGYYIVTWYFIN